MTESPWKSINNMLIKNSCWLCQQQFPRGQTKNVFQVSQLIDFFTTRLEEEKNGKVFEEFQSEFLKSCYENFKSKDTGNFDTLFETLSNELRENDIEVWMSGLVCAHNETCQKEVSLFIPAAFLVSANQASTEGRGSIIKRHKKSSAEMFAINSECPPGCGCDNPWPFLS